MVNIRNARDKTLIWYIMVSDVFPEDGQDVTGFQIIGIRDGILKNSDIKTGDIIYGANDTLIYDDPFAIEKAKAQYVEGKDMVLKIKRDSDYLEIKVAA